MAEKSDAIERQTEELEKRLQGKVDLDILRMALGRINSRLNLPTSYLRLLETIKEIDLNKRTLEAHAY